MAKFLTQEFTYAEETVKDGIKKKIDGSAYFWAQQDEHNHDKSNEFSKAALDWLAANAGWPRGKIREGKFMSSQSSHKPGKELKWKGTAKSGSWVKA